MLTANHVTVSCLVAPYRCPVLVCWIPFHKQKTSAAASEEIVNKRGKVSSPVWQFFGYYKSDRSQTNVVCKLCKTVVPAKTGNSTNLMYHLSRAHPLEHIRIQPTTSVAATPHKQQTAMERYSASVPYDKESKRYKDITEAVAYHIAKDMLPFRLDNY